MMLFCDQCTGPLVDAPDGDYRDPYAGPRVLRGVYGCETPECNRHFHPDPKAGYFSVRGPANFVQKPRCSKGHVAAVTYVDLDTGERKYGCVLCNVYLTESGRLDTPVIG
jgi:hypothetical protein